MKIERRNSASGKTLSIICEQKIRPSYQIGMVLENSIPYFVSPSSGMVDGRAVLLYDLSGLVSLGESFEDGTADGAFFRKLMLSLSGALDALDGYLIGREHLVISTGTVFLDSSKGELRFICYPYEKADPDKGLAALSEFLLSKLDNSDKDAVTLGHRFFRLCVKKNVNAFSLRRAAAVISDKEASGPEAETGGSENAEKTIKKGRISGALKKALFGLVGKEEEP